MRTLCWLTGHLWTRPNLLREDWIEAKGTLPKLIRFYECTHCRHTWATITSPDPEQASFAEPDRNGWNMGPIPHSNLPT